MWSANVSLKLWNCDCYFEDMNGNKFNFEEGSALENKNGYIFYNGEKVSVLGQTLLSIESVRRNGNFGYVVNILTFKLV